MKGILFGSVHSYRDLGLLLQPGKEIGAPAVKRDEIDVPGGDGKLDFTEFHGETKFGNVTHVFPFATIQPHKDFLTQYSRVKNALHGRKVRIILDDDPAFFYMGRCDVSKFTDEKGIGTITVTCDCEPYKYKIAKTVVTRSIDGTEIVNLTNSRKRAVPTITTTSEMTVSFGGGVWTNRAGTYTIPELELVEGDNLVAVTGNGTITFTWQEGDL